MIKRYRKPYRIRRKRHIWKSRFFWFSILFLMILGGLFYLICFSSIFQIKEIKVSGSQKVSTADFQKIIQDQIEKKILFFPSRSIFLVNLNKINKAILENFPQIAKVNLKRKFLDKLIVMIEERKAVAIFNQNENLFLLDKEGTIFEKVEKPEPELIRIKNLTLNREFKLGEKVVEKDIVSQILEINSKLNANFKIFLTEISIMSEERLNVKTLEGWEIYLNPKEGLDWQIARLNSVLKERVPLEKRKNLKYIDLRFEKVYIFPENYQ